MLPILIADDHAIVCLGLRLLIEKTLYEPCAIDFAHDGDEVLARLRQKEYAVLFCDLVMPDQKGVGLIAMALAIQPELKIIVISVGPDRDFAPQCLAAGARAYINKSTPDAGFAKILRAVLYDNDDLLPDNATGSFEVADPGVKEQQRFLSLSRREREVVLLLLRGHQSNEIAHIMSISISSVSSFKGRAFAKLKVYSLIGLNRLAYYHGLNLNTTMQF